MKKGHPQTEAMKQATAEIVLEANERKLAFLAALETHWPNISVAAREAGVSRTAVFDWRIKDPTVADRWNEIMQAKLDRLEHNLFEAGLSKGMVGLALSTLRAYRREVWGETMQHSGQVAQYHILSGVRGELTEGESVDVPALN